MELALTAGAGRHQSARSTLVGLRPRAEPTYPKAQFPAWAVRELVAVEAGYGVEPAGTVEQRFAASVRSAGPSQSLRFQAALIFAFRLGEQAFELHVACLCPPGDVWKPIVRQSLCHLVSKPYTSGGTRSERRVK